MSFIVPKLLMVHKQRAPGGARNAIFDALTVGQLKSAGGFGTLFLPAPPRPAIV